MPFTRSGTQRGAKQPALDELPGTSVRRKTGGGKRANELPSEERPAKTGRAARGGGGGGRKPAAAGRFGSERHGGSADDARAAAASVSTGESPQRKLQTATKQAGLKAEPTSSGGSGRDERKEVHLDKSEHHAAAPAKRGGGDGGAATKAAKAEAKAHPGKVVKINRAPVLTLWVKIVAQQEGYDEDAALTFGKAVSGMLAQSKGRRIGIYEEKEKEQQEPGRPHADRAEVFGMKVKVHRSGDGVRATGPSDKPLDPQQVRGYLKRAFGDDLPDAEAALGKLATSVPQDEIGHRGYSLYEKFRPTVSEGKPGWGQKADLNLAFISSLENEQRK